MSCAFQSNEAFGCPWIVLLSREGAHDGSGLGQPLMVVVLMVDAEHGAAAPVHQVQLERGMGRIDMGRYFARAAANAG
jgi:hypothetical protein